MASSSTTPFFGRAYSLTITPNQGPAAGMPIVISSDQFEPSALRFTFDVTQYAYKAFWFAEIVIYNCDGPITTGPSAGTNLYQAVIQEGDTVTLCAGYQADYPYPTTPPIIWQGPVFYTTKDRLDVVDQRLTICSVINRDLTTQNFINKTLPAGATRLSQAQFIAKESLTTIDINSSQVQAIVGNDQLPRAKTYFGNPHPYLHSLADQAGSLSWFDNKSWKTSFIGDPPSEVTTSFAPVPPGAKPRRLDGITYSLVGTPQQTQLGVNFRTLLEPTIQVAAPITWVGVQKQYVRQAPVVYGQFPALPLTDQYAVVGVRFFGDSRGNEWYSEFTGLSQIKTIFQLMAP